MKTHSKRKIVDSTAKELMKTCLGCEISKSLTEFHHCKTSKDGKKSRCKECRNRLNFIIRKMEK